MKFKTDMDQKAYEAPVEGKGPSERATTANIGKTVLIQGNIAALGQNGNNIEVTAVGPDPTAALMIKNSVFYPLSADAKWKFAELQAIHVKYAGRKIAFKDGELDVDDKALIGKEVGMEFEVTKSGPNAPEPGKPYWKMVRLVLPKA